MGPMRGELGLGARKECRAGSGGPRVYSTSPFILSSMSLGRGDVLAVTLLGRILPFIYGGETEEGLGGAPWTWGVLVWFLLLFLK